MVMEGDPLAAKRLLAVVVGSHDTQQHELSLKEGEKVAKMIEGEGKFDTCVLEVGKGPWKLHWDDKTGTFDKDKLMSIVGKKRVKPEVVLLLPRGKLAESGELQAFFDKAGIPFTFSGVEETKTCFNKSECNKLLKEEGLPVVKSILIEANKLATEEFFDKVQKQCGFPCVVKPNRGSGCLGVTKVNSRKEIKEAVDLAFKQDSQVVIEPAVTDGIEVSCTVHDMTTDELLEAFPVTEITPQGDEIFHSSELSKANLTTPSKTLSEEVIQQVVKVSKVAYRVLNLCGLATFDLIVQDDLPVLLEVNSVPMIGPDSLVNRQVKSTLSIRWLRNIAKFYTIVVEHSIANFDTIRTKKKTGGGRGV